MSSEYASMEELFSDESRWTKEYYAKDMYGNDVEATSKEAVKWCLIGGAAKVYYSKGKYPAILHLISINTGISPSMFNDQASYKEVYNLVKRLGI
jgi:hypothetical protein